MLLARTLGALVLALGLVHCGQDCDGATVLDDAGARDGWLFDTLQGDPASDDRQTPQDAHSVDDAARPDASGDDASMADAADRGDGADGDRGDAIDGAGAPDVATGDAAATDAALTDADLPASATLQHWLQGADDAVTSYLMDPGQGAWNQFSGDSVYLGRHWDLGHVSYHTGLRFAGVQLPPGAVVDDARLTFSPANDVDRSRNLWINIYAEDSGDSLPFDPQNNVSGRPDQRARSTAFVDHWLVRCNDSCTELTEYDCPQRQLDCWQRDLRVACPKQLAPLLQEVIDRPDWQAGNALSLLLINAATDEDGSAYQDHRALSAVDATRDPSTRPLLDVRYHLP